ncbi:hypothetical protein [Amycolatopsis minnesotensis]
MALGSWTATFRAITLMATPLAIVLIATMLGIQITVGDLRIGTTR